MFRVTRIAMFVLLLAACGSGGETGSTQDPAGAPVPEDQTMPDTSIDAVLERHAEALLAHEGIQGIYVGQNEAGEPCLVVMATVAAEELEGVVPDSLEGWPVRIESGDEIRPMH